MCFCFICTCTEGFSSNLDNECSLLIDYNIAKMLSIFCPNTMACCFYMYWTGIHDVLH